MKLPQFEYAAPTTLKEAIALLAARQGDAKPIAGGQSLIPILAFRLAGPSLLVDLRNVPGLDRIDVSSAGVTLGAKVRWCDIEADSRLRAAHPLLSAAVACVAHYQIRNRGTVGGSLAHADPAAELPGVAITCDAEIAITGATGSRTMRAADFFLAPLMTALEPDELIVEVRLPLWLSGRRWAFEEYARQRGAFALAGIALFYDENDDVAKNAHIGVIGASSRLHRLRAAETALNGRVVDERAISHVAEEGAREIDPTDDADVSADYRRALVRTLLERTLRAASTRTDARLERDRP